MGNKFKYTLTYNSIEYILYYAPQGWDSETLASFNRSKEYFGMIRSFSLPLRFVADGADILRNAFIQDGVEAGVRLKVEERQEQWNYLTVHVADIDFSTYEYDGISVSVNLMDSGANADIKSKDNITYEFPLIGDDVVDVELPGVRFDDRLVWSINPTIRPEVTGQMKYVPATDLITQSKSGYIEGFNRDQRLALNSDDFRGDVFAKNNRSTDVAVNVKGRAKGVLFRGFSDNANVCWLEIRKIKNNQSQGITVETIASLFNDRLGTGVEWSSDFEFTTTLQPGEGLYIYNETIGTANNDLLNTILEGDIEMSFETFSDPSPCKGLKGIDLFKRMMNRVSPAFEFRSDLITGKWSNLIFTSGSAIRELPDAKIKINFRDLYQCWKSLEDCGIGMDGEVLRLELASYFARPIEILNVGNVNRCQMSVATDYIASSVEIGYKDSNTTEDGGLEEYNSGVTYGIPITRTDNVLNWRSTVRADQFGIEKLRVLFNVKKESSADTDSDNSTFIIHCKEAVDNIYKPILGSDLDAVTGLTYPLDSYNLLISPKFNLIRHGGYLRSICDRIEDRFIEFASAEKNSALTVTTDDAIFSINKPEPISSLSGKYFKPYVFTINAKIPAYSIAKMASNQFGYITFNFNGNLCKGYLLEVNVDLAGSSEQEIKLLATFDSFLP